MFTYNSPFINQNKPRVTVVGEISENFLKIAVARCSSKDNFTRKKGKELAINRFNEGKYYMVIKLEKATTRKFVSVARMVAANIITNPREVNNCL
jgi:hypothetical protein